jgi:hypothetical protein
VTGRALGVALILWPFASALLLGLHRAGRALRNRLTRRRPAVTFHYRDADNDLLVASPGLDLDGQPVLHFATTPGGVDIPLDRLEELVAGLRDTARQAAGSAP